MEWLDLVSHFFLWGKLQFLFLLCETEIFHSYLVIGRGGEQISRIQQESGCKIQIAPGKSGFLAIKYFLKNYYCIYTWVLKLGLKLLFVMKQLLK